jgi:hypothetical protein
MLNFGHVTLKGSMVASCQVRDRTIAPATSVRARRSNDRLGPNPLSIGPGPSAHNGTYALPAAAHNRQYGRPGRAAVGGRHSGRVLHSGDQPGQAFYISTSTSVIAISGGPVKLGANRAITAA